jgi:hypothetical protein
MGVKNIRVKELFAIILVLTLAVFFNLILLHATYAFHNGGVGQCEGCHVMHNTKGNISNWLLPGRDPSSGCLNCHAGSGSPNSHHIASNDGSAMSPGGDFYWLQKNFFWAGGSSTGDRHGHNIIAQDYGFISDTTNNVAPGGSYMASDLGCNSCHDPHGKVSAGLPVQGSGSYGGTATPGTALGNYRLLGGYTYGGGRHVQWYSFINDTPVARQNSAIRFGEASGSHVDYGSDMSEWCANCHADVLNNRHQIGNSSFEHPVGNNALLEDFVDTYNSYVNTGDFSGIAATSYLALVPFERGVTNTALLNPTSSQGPDNSSNIMCLTCHRAHASAFKYIGRWDFDAQLIADSHPAAGDGGVTGNDVYYSYYGRDMDVEFGADQRILCEKCHEVPRSGYPPGW